MLLRDFITQIFKSKIPLTKLKIFKVLFTYFDKIDQLILYFFKYLLIVQRFMESL